MKITQEQSERWNGTAGQAWVRAQGLVDELFAPIERTLVDAVSGNRVLDVGCGTGGVTVAFARRAGESGRSVGVDISAPMVAAAEARAEAEGVRAEFVQADAAEHPFEPGGFDAIVSRFGVMFFSDPAKAFANLRRAAAPDAELRLVVWRGAEDNPFMTVAEQAAAPLVPGIPARVPDAPGQFGFADPDRVRAILTEAGWGEVDLQPVDFACSFPESALVGYFMQFGPLGMTIADADAETKARVVEAVRPAFDPYVDGDRVRLTAACWMVTAVNRADG